MNKGFVLTMEAVISILLFGIAILCINLPSENSLKELLIIQQENDLLKVWSIDFPSESEMILDTKSLFENASVYLDGAEILKGSGNESVSSEGIIIDDFLIERKIRIVVYLN